MTSLVQNRARLAFVVVVLLPWWFAGQASAQTDPTIDCSQLTMSITGDVTRTGSGTYVAPAAGGEFKVTLTGPYPCWGGSSQLSTTFLRFNGFEGGTVTQCGVGSSYTWKYLIVPNPYSYARGESLTVNGTLGGDCIEQKYPGGRVHIYPVTPGPTFNFAFMQPPAPCPVTLVPAISLVPAAGGIRTISVGAAQTCSWTAVSNQSWARVTGGGSGTGGGTVTYDVGPNLTDFSRSATITIGDQLFAITQDPGWIRVFDPVPSVLDGSGTRVSDDPWRVAIQPSAMVRVGAAADGVSKLLVAIRSTHSLKMTLPGGVADGTLERLGGGSADSCLSRDTGDPQSPISVAVYTPPDGLGAAGLRTINVEVSDPLDPSSGSLFVPIKLEYVPVVLVHGFNSGPDMWASFQAYLEGSGFSVYPVDYGYWSRNSIMGGQAIFQLLRTIEQDAVRKAHDRSIAAARVDVVAHSMGGLVTRGLVPLLGRYMKPENYGGGWVRRLITIGTPHGGIPFVSSLIAKAGGSLPPAGPVGDAVRLVARIMFGRDSDLSAVETFVPNSPMLQALPVGAIPMHTIVGEWRTGEAEAYELVSKMFITLGLGTLDQAFNSERHDLLVGESSASAGQVVPVSGYSGDACMSYTGPAILTGSASRFSSVTHSTAFPKSHCTEANAPGIRGEVFRLLTGPSSPFAGGVGSRVVSDAVSGSNDETGSRQVFTSLDAAADQGLTIVEPASGGSVTLTQGATLRITAQATGVTAQNIMFLVEGVGIFEAPSAPPFSVTIPLSETTPLGTMQVTVIALDSAGALLADSVTVTVLPASAPSSIQVTPTVMMLGPNLPLLPIRVTATFGTGQAAVIQDVTGLAVYSVLSGTAVRVTANGVVSGNASGESVVQVTYGGQTAQVSVTNATQEGTCTYTLSGTGATIASAGGAGSITVSTQDGCNWTAASGDSFISLANSFGGTGTGTLGFSVPANALPTLRRGTLTIAGQLVTVTQTGQAPPVNGGFENGVANAPTSWTTGAWQQTSTFTWDGAVAHAGAHSVRIDSASPNDTGWYQAVSLEPNTNYLLSGWIKTQDVANTAESENAGANLCVRDTWLRTPTLVGTHDWTYVRLVFNSGPTGQVSIGARVGFYSGTTTGTAWFDDIRLTPIHASAPHPRWKVLVLIYKSTDFTYMRDGVSHHVVGAISQARLAAAASAATRFVETDIPELTSGHMIPRLTIRYPEVLTHLTTMGTGWWPSPGDTTADRDPAAFDSVIVIWEPNVVDQATGQPLWIGAAQTVTMPNGTEQTYVTMSVDAAANQESRNAFKKEWGHGILFYFDATGMAPKPAVNNNATAVQYVNCQTGLPYVWLDETDANPIPNSIYHNASGFTHDYYSGTTALAANPTACLGITADAWATGGPVNMPGDNPPAITTHPVSTSTVVGSTMSFAVVVSGNPEPTVQWQVSEDVGATWTNLTEAPPYGGVTTTTLTVAAAPFSLHGHQYRAIATNGIGVATSRGATLTIAKVTPLVTWANPSGIAFGTPLSATQLNATANVPGTFVYTPPAGTVLNPGVGQSLLVVFTPADVATYATASKSVTIDVAMTTPVNGGFENGTGSSPFGWSQDSWQPTASFEWDTSVVHTGARSAKIVAPAENDAGWYQSVSLEPNTNYLLSGWIKTQDIPDADASSSAGANLCLMGGWMHTPTLVGTHDWTYVRMLFNAGATGQVTIGARIGFYGATTTGTAWFDDIRLTPIRAADPHPRWNVLVLIYKTTDFTYSSGGVSRHVVSSMNQARLDAAAAAATRFVETDIPVLTSGNMVPRLTIRYAETLTHLSAFRAGWWPAPGDTAAERSPEFDSVIVLWEPNVVDQATGQALWIGESDGLTLANGTGPTYTSMQVDAAISRGHLNVFKHEWGHAILFYFEAAGTAPTPGVDNHAVASQYVNCQTGVSYVWVDETDVNPIPNSIYHNASGFTHDYYSGTTALATNPTACLGITAEAWAMGGPVSMPGDSPPAVTSHPVGTSAVVGSTMSFAVVVSGNPEPAVQWQVSVDAGTTWTDVTEAPPYGGVTMTTLVVTAVPFSLTGHQYRAIATNGIGAATSHAAVLTVTQAAPVVTWATPAPIVYGTALGATQLNASANVPGAFVYTPPAGTVLNAGAGQTLLVTFTPTDAINYTGATKTVTIDVTKATPVVTWANPAAMTAGTALGATQLNATAGLAGTFVYTPPAGTVLSVGLGQTLSATFTPTDVVNYTTATKTVLIDVVVSTGPPLITDVAPGSGAIGSGVTLTGTGFTGATGVTFHGVSAAYAVVSDTLVTTTVPAGTTTGRVRVTTPGGTAASATDFVVTNQRATRTLPGCYVAGYAMTVSVDVGPAPEVLVQALEDAPPAGWTVGTISDGGGWDAVTSQVKWGPYFDATARVLTYVATPPAGTTGTVTFAGVASFDGVEVPLGGTATLARCEQHPADANTDFRMAIGEVTGYGAAWKKGSTWIVPPVPIPIGYVTRAGYLWRVGETYRRDALGDYPLCWVPLTAVPLPVPDGFLSLEDIPSPRSGPWSPEFAGSEDPASITRWSPGSPDAGDSERLRSPGASLRLRSGPAAPGAPAPNSPVRRTRIGSAGSPFDSRPIAALAQGRKDPASMSRWSPGSSSDPWSPGSLDPGDPGSAVRQAPATYVPSVPLTVTLTVAPDADVQTWAVEETVPAGWHVSVVSADGFWDEKAGVVRWGPFFDEAPQTLRYTLTPPAGASGPQDLRGTASFDGADVAVTGAHTIQRAPITRPGDPGGHEDGGLR